MAHFPSAKNCLNNELQISVDEMEFQFFCSNKHYLTHCTH